MIYQNKKNLLSYSFLFFISLLLIRLCLRSTILEADEAEQIVYAQYFLTGYPSQPPLYSWLQYILFQVFGISLFSVAFLKSLLLTSALFLYHSICRLYCSNNRLALCATLGWVLIPAISLDLLKDNTHTVLALLIACMTWYCFAAPSKLAKPLWYLRLGIVIGLGLLSKFNYLFFLLIFLGSALSLKQFRVKILDNYFLMTLFIAFLVALPYGLWLYHHIDMGLHSLYKIAPSEKTKIHGMRELIRTCFFFTAPILIISYLFFPIKLRTISFNTLPGRYFLLSMPVLLMIVIVGGFRDFETRWLVPVLFLTPVFYFSQIKETCKNRERLFINLCIVIQLILISTLVYKSHFGQNKRQQIPIIDIISAIQKSPASINYLISDFPWLLGNAKVKKPDLAIYLPYAQPDSLNNKQVMLLWSGNKPDWVKTAMEHYQLTKIQVFKNPVNGQCIAAIASL